MKWLIVCGLRMLNIIAEYHNIDKLSKLKTVIIDDNNNIEIIDSNIDSDMYNNDGL